MLKQNTRDSGVTVESGEDTLTAVPIVTGTSAVTEKGVPITGPNFFGGVGLIATRVRRRLACA